MILLEFVESAIFTRQARASLSVAEYTQLQLYLLTNPDAGALIAGSGGLRKLRWGLSRRGKRGGVRIIYFVQSAAGRIFMLYLYRKNDQTDLTVDQLRRILRLMGDE